ncbi:MAG: 4Fe-4S binding protein [Oscillospiraceae bacterium]|nr:4Fe-4S binding protein [Oscillospiraceae bacterium]
MSDIKQQIESNKYGIKIAVIPVELLKDIKSDIVKLRESEELNGFQQWIMNDAYVLELPDPEPDFTAKSIVIAISPRNMVRGIFNYKNKKAEHIFDMSQDGVNDFIHGVFNSNGYKLQSIDWFPQKRLAVRSGLAEYGRNNIVYADGMGSFLALDTYKSDMPCDEKYTWREVKNMDLCDGCNLCIENCPTKAILPDRFLIDNVKCLTAVNENGTEPFPDWIPKTAHHRIVGCFRCQDICPKNQEILNNITETLEFSEEETNLLLSGTPIENLPQMLKDKAYKYNISGHYESTPRNLSAMLENI